MAREDKEYLRETVQTILEGGVGQQWYKPNLRNQPHGNEMGAWQCCSELVEKYDKDMCEAYREQIDTLLVVAGLFSAVITAFTVESYEWLYDGPADASVVLLAQIVSILAQNQTSTPLQFPARRSNMLNMDGAAVRINTCWFLSLTLSLSAALVGILAKQWIREYERDAGRTHLDALGIRQMKFNGFETWRVDTIVASVPLLLQAALVLFFVGVLELLWLLNPGIAIPVTVIACHIAIFYIATTLLPSFQFVYWYFTPESVAAQCPYKSPQSWFVLYAVRALVSFFRARKNAVDKDGLFGDNSERILAATELLRRANSWIKFDLACMSLSDVEAVDRPEYRYEALAWLRRTLDHADLHYWIWHCLWACSKTGRLTARSASNVRCVLDCIGCRARVPPGPEDSPLTSRNFTLLLPRALLLEYSFATCAQPRVVIELLHRLHQTAQSRTPQYADWTAAWIAKIFAEYYLTSSAVPVDEEVCEYLLSIVNGMAAPAHEPSMLGHTLRTVLTIMRRAPASETRDRLIMAICPLTRRWLQQHDLVEREELRLWLDVATSICASICSVFAGREPDARRTRIMAELAKAIDYYWKSCLGEKGAREDVAYAVVGWNPYLAETFRQLVSYEDDQTTTPWNLRLQFDGSL